MAVRIQQTALARRQREQTRCCATSRRAGARSRTEPARNQPWWAGLILKLAGHTCIRRGVERTAPIQEQSGAPCCDPRPPLDSLDASARLDADLQDFRAPISNGLPE